VGQFLSGTITYAKDEIGKKVVSLILFVKFVLFYYNAHNKIQLIHVQI
jgi:hypothetical protein